MLEIVWSREAKRLAVSSKLIGPIKKTVSLQEMYGEFIDELRNPSLLKPFDEIFELQLPLRNAKLKFHSKVMANRYFKATTTLGHTQYHFNSLCNRHCLPFDLGVQRNVDQSAGIILQRESR